MRPSLILPIFWLLLFTVSVLQGEENVERDEKVELKKDLELWLPFQDGFRDYSKNHHVGEVNGNLRIASDGAHFDGEGDHLIFPAFDFKEKPFAISTWIRVTGHFGNYGILQQKGGGKKQEWLHLVLRDKMQPMFSFYVVNTLGESHFSKAEPWQHLLVQYTGEKCEIYVNGKLDVSAKKPAFLGKGGKFIIGLSPKWSNVPSRDFEGTLSEFRVYSRALNLSEISYLASMHSGGK